MELKTTAKWRKEYFETSMEDCGYEIVENLISDIQALESRCAELESALGVAVVALKVGIAALKGEK